MFANEEENQKVASPSLDLPLEGSSTKGYLIISEGVFGAEG
jgi:hypothetical protein